MNKLIFFLTYLLPALCFSGQFNSAFLTFDLPKNWSCKHIAGSWNCSNPNNSKTKGLIVVTTKKPKIGSTMSSFKSKLLQPKKTTWNNKTILSEPQSAEELSIRGQKWIQATHLNGEIPNSTTKYLITIKNGLAILVTFTAQNQDYPKLSSSFLKSIESLRLRGKNSPTTRNQNLAQQNSLPTGQMSQGLDELFETDHKKTTGSALTMGSLQKIGILVLILLGVVFFLLSKKRKK